MSGIKFDLKGNQMNIHLDNKVVSVRGHLDEDAYRIFSESFETSSLTSEEQDRIRVALKGRKDIVID